LVNYAVTEDANRAMGLFGLFGACYPFMVATLKNAADMTDLLR